MSIDITTIGVALDTSGLEKGARAFKDAEQSANRAADAASKVGAASSGAAASYGSVRSAVDKLTAEETKYLQKLVDEYKQLSSNRGQMEAYRAAQSGMSKGAQELAAAVGSKIEAYKRERQEMDKVSSAMGEMKRMAAGLLAGVTVGAFLGKIVAVQREFDVLNSSLKTVTGSSAAAEREMAWLKDFAKETPFGLAQATQGFVKMKALGLDPTRAALTSFGNTASAMGKDLNQMIEAVADASTGEFERLKEFGIKAKKEGDQVSLTFQGVTTTIQNSAADITKYLENIGNVSFGGAMEERAKTLDGTIAALGDTWDELFRTVSTNNVGSLIFDSVTLANGALEDATTILRAMGGAAQDASRDTGALSTIQNGIATVFETVAVLGANLKYVLVQIGNEIGGLAAQAAQAAQFNFAGVRAIREQMVADAEAARREIDATTERILNARKAQEEYARWSTRNASAATDPRRIDLGGPASNGGGTSKPGKPKKEELSDYDKLIQKLGQEIPKAAAEAEAAQMGYNKAQTEFLALAGSPTWASFTNSQRAVVASMFESKIASEQAGDAVKELSKAYAEAAAERIKTIQSMERAADGLQSQNDALRAEIELIGLSAAQQTQVLQQRNEAIILTKEATLAELERQSAVTGTQTRVEIALAAEIAALKERNALLGAKAGKNAALETEKANKDAAQKAQDEWQKATDQINQSLTDALMRGFESGKDFAKNLRDTVANMFKTLVLRPIISAVVNPVAGAITGALGLAGTANAAASGASTLGGIGNLASLGSNLFSSGLGSTISGAIGSGVGALFGTTAGNAALGTSLGLGAGSATAAAAAAAQAGGASAAAAASAASTGASIAGALPYIGAAVAALSLLAGKFSGETRTGGQFGVAFDGSVTNQRRGQTYTIEGQQFDRDFTNGLQTALKDGIAYRLEGDPVAQESAIREAVAGTASGINGFLKALGSSATLTGFSAGLETSGKGRGGVFAGGLLSTGAAFGESGKGDNYAGTLYEKFSTNSPDFKQALTDFTLDLKQSTIQALQTVSDIPQAVQKMLQGVDTEALTDDAANKLLETINAQIVGVERLRVSFENIGLDKLAEMSFDAASGLAAAAGGFDALQGKLATYYDNFYSDAEKTANTTRAVSAALAEVGIELPKTRAEFRALVEAQMALGESGTQAVAALLGVSGAFASITEAATLAQEQAVKAAAADRKDRLAAQRAQEKQEAEALQKQVEAYAEGAEQFNTLRDSLLKAGDAAGLLAAVTERAFADPSGKYMSGKYELPRWESTDTAASFNYRYGEMQARMRQQLGDEASANALRIENVKGVLGSFSVEQMMSEYDPVTGPLKIAIQQAIVDASGDVGYAVRDAVSGAALYAAMADVRAQYTSRGPGLASIAAARATAADASRTSIDPATGLYRIGGAAVEYGKALDNLQGALNSGAIDAGTFERAVKALGSALPGAAESIGTLEDAIAAAQSASYDVGTAGLNSIRHYFGSLSELTAEFAKAAVEAQEPIAKTTAAIGRLNSAQYAFAGSAAAALQGFGGGGEGGAWMLQDAGVTQDITRAQLIAEAAGIASAAMTTADAAAAAVKLAKNPAFAELDKQGIRDAALLLDGVGEYNADGFERAFIRISDALAKGNVTESQYKALFDVALDMFEGVPEETRKLIDSMTRLRDAMSSFADGLLIDKQRTTLSAGGTLAEMQRQYAQAFAGASTGDNEAIGKYQQLATTLLDKDLYSTRAEYNAAFGSVYGDARRLENIGVNTLANAQGDAMVSELKDMNTKLNKRVEGLEKNLLAALAQIAKNTSDTSRGIEQQIVMAEDTP